MWKKAFEDLLEYIKNNTCEVSEDDGIVSLKIRKFAKEKIKYE